MNNNRVRNLRGRYWSGGFFFSLNTGCSTFGPLSFQRRKTSLPSCRASRSSTTRSWSSTRATPGCEQEEKQEFTDLKKRLLIGSLLVIVTPLKSRLCGDYCLLNKKSAIWFYCHTSIYNCELACTCCWWGEVEIASPPWPRAIRMSPLVLEIIGELNSS